MGFLSDTLVRQEINAGNLMTGIDPQSVNKAVHGCSVDMHIGGIYVPTDSDSKAIASALKALGKGGTTKAHDEVVLKEGETAVLITAEEFNLSSQHAAFAFPASSISIRGLLMTNPGHVDPGYTGPLHVTVINMGKEAFILRKNDRFLRAFIYDLGAKVTSAYVKQQTPFDIDTTLNRLSPDFLSINRRTADAVKTKVDASMRTGHVLQFVIPAFFSLLAALATGLYTNFSLKEKFEDRVKALEEVKALDRIKVLELSYPTERRLAAIETELKKRGAKGD